MTKMKKICIPVLAAAALAFSVPGTTQEAEASCNTYRVNVVTGYLALRTDTSYNSGNEIGELYSGDLVEVLDYTGATGYWYVYSPKYDDFGYVNNDYLDSVTSSVSSYDTMWTVSVSTGYLALRNAPEYDASNEIGELYSGDTVWVSDSSNSQYWYVYSPKLDGYGYVNQEYLYREEGLATLYVKVPTGYLALRSAMGYDAANEIGELNTGDTVVVIDSSSDKYWYVYSPRLMKYGYADCNYIFCN